MAKSSPGKHYTLNTGIKPRLLSETLGRKKYRTLESGLVELVANALDAGARNVNITVDYNELERVEAITVADDGRGMSPETLRDRFMYVAVEAPEGVTGRMGRFGVGRYAVFAVGTASYWTSISNVDGNLAELTFRLQEGATEVPVDEKPASPGASTGTRVEVRGISEPLDRRIEKRISDELVARFCALLLVERHRRISINGMAVDFLLAVEKHVPETVLVPSLGTEADARIDHYTLHHSRAQMRLQSTPLIFAAGGMTVATASQDEVDAEPTYLGIVTCPVLEEQILNKREALLDMDTDFSALKDAAVGRASEYQEILRLGRRHLFIRQAREKPYYPFQHVANDSLEETKREIFDLSLELANKKVNIAAMAEPAQRLIFQLLSRAVNDDDLVQVLGKLLKLSEAEMADLRDLLERVTLQSVLRMAKEVEQRLEFLDLLQELIYGDTGKHLRERSQLHKIIEGQTWIFGERFHLATSDQSFRSIIAAHRESANLPAAESLQEIKGLNDIPDLFLGARKNYADPFPTISLLVELKAPSVTVGIKELEQGRRYSRTLLTSPDIDKSSTRWEVFVVSGKISGEARVEIEVTGLVKDYGGVHLWAFEWSQLIERSRREMALVSQHISRTSRELDLKAKLRERYPDILGDQDDPPATPPS